MNKGVHRFLSRREKKGKGSSSNGSANASDGKVSHIHVHRELYKIFHPESKIKPDKEEEKKIKTILQRLEGLSVTDITDSNIQYALLSPSARGDSDKAFDLILLYRDALHGTLRDIKPATLMVGAENRHNVTCYLDSLLFAMFARVDSFEMILADVATADGGRKDLATVLRVWVNMLRNGKLITTDITERLQETLKDCGWEEAALLKQQDVSEAFSFITGKLNLPLLTLKMDVYHTGKEDNDDHRIVRERLLEVAIPEAPEPTEEGENPPVIKLEDCLESYFNNKIEVKRHMQRRNTMQSMRPGEKGAVTHVETIELNGRPGSPSSLRSVFSQRRVDNADSNDKKTHDDISIQSGRPRTSTIRQEVLMPAWQFFNLIPWNNVAAQPKNDAQVALQLQNTKPVLGICLKRYSFTAGGTATRRETHIDIPLEIGLPHFISDDGGGSEGVEPIFTNFKLSLQSVICHRGKSLDAGHYVSLVRDQNPSTPRSPEKPWLLFDDLHVKERIRKVDIHKALMDEVPYLLFYQVLPIDDDDEEEFDRRGDPPLCDPPTYDEATLTSQPELTKGPSRSTTTETIDTTPMTDTSSTNITSSTDPPPKKPDPKRLPSMLDVGLPKTTSPPSMLELKGPSEERTNSADTINTLKHIHPIPDILTKSPTAATSPPMDLTLVDLPRPKSMDLAGLSSEAQRSSLDIPRGRTSFNTDRRSSITFTDNSASNKGGSTAPVTPGEESEAKSAYLSASRRNSLSKSWRRSKSRPTSQSGDNRLSFGMSRLKNAMSKDKLGLTPTPTLSAGASTDDSNAHEVPPVEKPEKGKNGTLGRGKSLKIKKGRRNSSTARKLDDTVANGVEGKSQKPDRECVVM